MILKYDKLIFRGAIIKIDGASIIDDNGFYILTISNDSERPLLLVKVSGYKAGLERGFIRCEKIQKGTVGITMKNLIEELQWRGLVHDIMPGTEEQLLKEPTAVYIGFDPTSDSLHIGSLVPILLLKHIRNYGHRPIALVGGATGMIGDPSGKSNERNLLDEATLNHNVEGIKGVLSHFLDETIFFY